MNKILIFGDSISWGAFDTEKGGWVERLKADLMGDHNLLFHAIYNFAVSGFTTQDVLDFFDQDISKIQRIDPTHPIILFFIGMNDAQNSSGISLEQFKLNISRLHAKAKLHTPFIRFIGLIHVDEHLTVPFVMKNYWQNNTISQYDNVLREFCQINSVHFLSLIDILEISDFSDGVHPNSIGHKKIYESVKKFLEKK